MTSKKTIIYTVLLITGVLVLLNFLSNKFFFRLDLTEDKRYTLSDATKDILENLEEPVTVTAYFSENLPTEYDKVRRDFKELLVEYSTLSGGMLVYEFINPLENEETEKQAVQAGVMQQQIPSREKDEIKLQKAFTGAVIQMGEDEEVIPVIESGTGMEYKLSTSIKKLSVTDKPLVGFLRGHGEPSIRQMQQVLYELEILYQVERVTLTDSTTALDKYHTVAIIAPADSFPSSHISQINDYLKRGGRLFIALDRVDADLNNNPMGYSVNTGLENWLSSLGIQVNNNFVIDETCVPVSVQMQQGPFVVTQQIQFPYFPLITNFEDHPISSGLEQVVFQFVSSINYSGDTSLVFTPLIKTSENSGTQPSTTYFNLQKEWTENDFPLSNLTLAAALEGSINNSVNTKLVVVGDGSFPVGGGEGRQNQINPDNVSLMVNSIDWLSDDTGLIDLRTKGVTNRPLDELEDSKRTFLKYLNFLLPILLIVIYGIFRTQRRQTLRIKRMEEGYVQ